MNWWGLAEGGRQLLARWARENLCWFFHLHNHSEWWKHSSKNNRLSPVLRATTAHYTSSVTTSEQHRCSSWDNRFFMVPRATSTHLALHLTTSERCRSSSMSNRFSMVLRAITAHCPQCRAYVYRRHIPLMHRAYFLVSTQFKLCHSLWSSGVKVWNRTKHYYDTHHTVILITQQTLCSMLTLPSDSSGNRIS
jgi:hypothetical protein